MTTATTPWEPPVAGTEVEHLVGALERLRMTFRWKASGLDAAGLAHRLLPSTMTLGGLVKHLALVEDHTFVILIAGETFGQPWHDVDWDADPDWDWHSAADDSPVELYALWDAAVERSRGRLAAILADGGLDRPGSHIGRNGERPSIRRFVVDLLEEYGRHTGHADLLREAVDCLVGEEPPAGWRP